METLSSRESTFEKFIPEEYRHIYFEELEKIKTMTRSEYIKYYTLKSIERTNNSEGDLTGYDCPECKNRGYFAKLDDDGHEVTVECKCMKIRRAKSRLEKSGLARTAEKSTFRTFETTEDWQKQVKYSAMNYANNNNNQWFYMAGQSGCGKTHICTAICIYLINQGHEVRYVLWRDLLHELESMRFKETGYSDKMQWLKSIEVLYIDDFLKSSGKNPSDNEINFAYETINARYIARKVTIISSEFLKEEIYRIDSALAGRIFEMAGEFIVQISPDNNKNYRLRRV